MRLSTMAHPHSHPHPYPSQHLRLHPYLHPHSYPYLKLRLLLRCDRCHTESVWKPQKATMQFNHDDRKDALMPLLGSHRDVACSK